MDAWQRTELARHPQRPYLLDYVQHMFTDFSEIHGDRAFGDDPAMICGMARFHGEEVLVVGTQKGRDTKQKVYRNFGMPNPEGYRKAIRAMQMAEKFGRPIFTFIDTPGAYPGLGAEERGQGEAIAYNLREMSRLKVPILVHDYGRGRLGRRAGDCRGRPGLHAGKQHLFGDFAGGLRLHHVARRQQAQPGRRGDAHHRAGPDRLRHHRRDCARTRGRARTPITRRRRRIWTRCWWRAWRS